MCKKPVKEVGKLVKVRFLVLCKSCRDKLRKVKR